MAIGNLIIQGKAKEAKEEIKYWIDKRMAQRVINEQQPTHSKYENSFDAVGIMKRTLNEVDEFYVYRINNGSLNGESDYVFKSNIPKVQPVQQVVQILQVQQVHRVQRYSIKENNPPVCIFTNGLVIHMCAGCGHEIMQEQKDYPTNMVFQKKGLVAFYNPKQNQMNIKDQNIHFHLNMQCLRTNDRMTEYRHLTTNDEYLNNCLWSKWKYCKN